MPVVLMVHIYILKKLKVDIRMLLVMNILVGLRIKLERSEFVWEQVIIKTHMQRQVLAMVKDIFVVWQDLFN